MLRTLTRLFGRPQRGEQLALNFEAPPRTADELLVRLRELGLARIERCRLTRNRTVMVSYSGTELRVHEGYLDAPLEILRAIVLFAQGRTRAERRAARDALLTYRIEHRTAGAPRRRERCHPEDETLAAKLAEWHERYRREHFGGSLSPLPIRVSRRMRSRLGHYTAATPGGEPAEIAISRRHIKRHGWPEALHTLLHEMVHQWQDEQGLAIDHGPTFRRKAREVGITASACRTLLSKPPREPRETQHSVAWRAAREE